MSIDVIETEPTFLPSAKGQGLGVRGMSRLGDVTVETLQVLQKRLQSKRIRAATLKAGDLGSIIPGFVSTGDALTALEQTKRYIDSVDEQIHRSFCQRVTPTPFGPAFSECGQLSFLIAWNSFANSYYDFYLEHRSFLSRFADTNSIYDRALRFSTRANQFRADALKLGAKVSDPDLKLDPRKNPLDDIMGWIKVLGSIAVLVWLSPPVIRALRGTSVSGLDQAFKIPRKKKVQKLLPKSYFDQRSFRWIKSGKARILIGCPKGKWSPKKQRCRVGTRAYEIVRPK